MTHGIHKGLTQMQLDRLEQDRRHIARITSAADGRMRERTAREQLAAAQRELARGPDDVIDNTDDQSAWSNKFQ